MQKFGSTGSHTPRNVPDQQCCKALHKQPQGGQLKVGRYHVIPFGNVDSCDPSGMVVSKVTIPK
jgi:hypothetical protein